VGKAHDRNLLKRWCREYYRRNKARFDSGRDYVVIFSPNHGLSGYDELEARFARMLEKAVGRSKSAVD
jgi:ribonuclease P protein component